MVHQTNQLFILFDTKLNIFLCLTVICVSHLTLYTAWRRHSQFERYTKILNYMNFIKLNFLTFWVATCSLSNVDQAWYESIGGGGAKKLCTGPWKNTILEKIFIPF